MNRQKLHTLIIALSFFFSLAVPAFAATDRDFSNQPSSPDPVVRSDGAKVPQPSRGEDIKNDSKIEPVTESVKKDPVVRNDGAKVPQPSRGEGIKSESKIEPVTESVKKDPVVRNDGAKVPQPSRGEDIKSESRIETVN